MVSTCTLHVPTLRLSDDEVKCKNQEFSPHPCFHEQEPATNSFKCRFHNVNGNALYRSSTSKDQPTSPASTHGHLLNVYSIYTMSALENHIRILILPAAKGTILFQRSKLLYLGRRLRRKSTNCKVKLKKHCLIQQEIIISVSVTTVGDQIKMLYKTCHPLEIRAKKIQVLLLLLHKNPLIKMPHNWKDLITLKQRRKEQCSTWMGSIWKHQRQSKRRAWCVSEKEGK